MVGKPAPLVGTHSFRTGRSIGYLCSLCGLLGVEAVDRLFGVICRWLWPGLRLELFSYILVHFPSEDNVEKRSGIRWSPSFQLHPSDSLAPSVRQLWHRGKSGSRPGVYDFHTRQFFDGEVRVQGKAFAAPQSLGSVCTSNQTTVFI